MSGGERKLLGRWGEAQAATFLRERGYRVVASGWRCRYGEIDLITEKGPFLCFVEVKLRKDDQFAPARAFVDRGKQNKLRKAAELYLSQYEGALQPRFDVAEVYAPDGTKTQEPVVHYLENAF